jgi:hypothetical protein
MWGLIRPLSPSLWKSPGAPGVREEDRLVRKAYTTVHVYTYMRRCSSTHMYPCTHVHCCVHTCTRAHIRTHTCRARSRSASSPSIDLSYPKPEAVSVEKQGFFPDYFKHANKICRTLLTGHLDGFSESLKCSWLYVQIHGHIYRDPGSCSLHVFLLQWLFQSGPSL